MYEDIQTTNQDHEQEIWSSKPSQIENSIPFIMGLFGLFLMAFIYQRVVWIIPNFDNADAAVNSIFMFLFFIFLYPSIAAFWRFLVTYNTKFELTSQRFLMSYGVFNKDTNTLELYRVKDYQVYKPLSLRLFGLGNLIMTTSDESDPYVKVSAIRRVDRLLPLIRHHVEICRMAKGVRSMDFHSQ